MGNEANRACYPSARWSCEDWRCEDRGLCSLWQWTLRKPSSRGHLFLEGETRAAQVLMRMLSFLWQNLLEIQTYTSLLQQIIQTTPQAAAITDGTKEVRAGTQAAGKRIWRFLLQHLGPSSHTPGKGKGVRRTDCAELRWVSSSPLGFVFTCEVYSCSPSQTVNATL